MTARLELVHQAPTAPARSAPALLFVHGAYCGAWCWQINYLPWFAARGYDCWALSLEGHAASDGIGYLAAIGIEDYRRNLADTIARLPAPPVVIGHSMGGFVLQRYLAHTALPGAVMLASVPPAGLAASTLNMMAHAPSLLMKLNLFQNGQYAPNLDELRELLFSPEAPQEALTACLQHCQPESQRALLDMTLINPLLIEPPRPTPALVLGAEHDLLIAPADVDATARLMGTTATLLPGLGHMMMLDAGWETGAERIAAWLAAQWG